MTLKLFPDPVSAQWALAIALADVIKSATGDIRLALAGGRTPETAYAFLKHILMREGPCRASMKILVADDRPGEGMPNLRMISRVLGEPLNIACRGPSEVDSILLDNKSACAKPLEATVLGLGTDGHIAGLFSESDLFSQALVLHTWAPDGSECTTLGLSALARSAKVFIIATGSEKATAVRGLYSGAATPGATVARWSQTCCLSDQAAGKLLETV